MSPSAVESLLAPIVRREGGGPAGWERRLGLFLDLLQERNRKVNLISRRTAEDVLPRQVLPSLAALRVVPPGGPVRVLDVGSGGGFPGIPLAILRPGVRLDLVESIGKKCDFLEEAVAALGLEQAAVHRCRIEAPTRELQERAPFDVALARAVGSDDLLRTSVRPLVAAGGSLWTYTSPDEHPPILWEDAGGNPLTGLRDLLA